MSARTCAGTYADRRRRVRPFLGEDEAKLQPNAPLRHRAKCRWAAVELAARIAKLVAAAVAAAVTAARINAAITAAGVIAASAKLDRRTSAKERSTVSQIARSRKMREDCV